MDKNTIIGLVIILALFLGFSWWNTPSKEELAERQRITDSIAEAQQKQKIIDAALAKAQEQLDEQERQQADTMSVEEKQRLQQSRFDVFANASMGEDTTFVVETNRLRITFASKGGYVKDVLLKEFVTYDSLPLQLLEGNKAAFSFFCNNRNISTADLSFELAEQKRLADGSTQLLLRAYTDSAGVRNANSYIEYAYTVRDDSYLVDWQIGLVNLKGSIDAATSAIALQWNATLHQHEKSTQSEMRQTTVYYRDSEETDNLSETKSDKEEITTSLRWVSFKQLFFNATLFSGTSKELLSRESRKDQPSELFESGSMEVVHEGNDKTMRADRSLKSMQAQLYLPVSDLSNNRNNMTFYFGPNKYRELRKFHTDLERIIPLGWGFAPMAWVNKYAVIPIFNWLESYGINYGIIILVLTILLKLVLLPIARSTYLSSARMRVVKPEIEEINQRYPKQEDSMKKQQAIMQLYKQAGIKPAAGCLPMLIQLPILIAMFRFFPSAFELRQQPFLWAEDLSTYDSILDLGFTIPFYGDHVSLFTLLMTAATLIYTYISNKQMSMGNDQQAKMMKWMMFLMPIMFLGIFNDYSSGLSYYYFLVNIITFLQMWLFRALIDEDKLRKKMKEAKLKPVQKSKWEKKMEEMMKQQQQAQRNAKRK